MVHEIDLDIIPNSFTTITDILKYLYSEFGLTEETYILISINNFVCLRLSFPYKHVQGDRGYNLIGYYGPNGYNNITNASYIEDDECIIAIKNKKEEYRVINKKRRDFKKDIKELLC